MLVAAVTATGDGRTIVRGFSVLPLLVVLSASVRPAAIPQAGIGVANKGKGTVLGRVEKLRVKTNYGLAVILEQSPGAGQ